MHCFSEFIIKNDESLLDGIHFKNGSLNINRIKKVHERYKDIPTMILDATPNEMVVRKIYPNFKYEKISVKTKESINIYQLSNKNITKDYLEDKEKREILINGIAEISANYKKVGLVTYQSLSKEKDFISNFAESLGIENYVHFGNLRGSNDFEDVDCLLVVGRHSLSKDGNIEFSNAVFGTSDDSSERYHVDKNIRMKDGRVFSINNLMYENDALQSIYEHKSISETIQAIGRGRLVHGKDKDIFLFSCESLGIDTEITDFFRLEDSIFGKAEEERIKNIESIDIRNNSLAKLLIEIFPDYNANMNIYVKNNKKEILEELKNIGFVNDPSKTKTLINSSLKNTEAVH